MSELLSIGGTYVDINCRDFPIDEQGLRSETETVGSDYVLDAGGSAPNFARLCSALGLPTTFIGKVGRDPMGQLFADLLRQAGVQPALIEDPGVQTNIGMNFVDTSGGSIMTVAGNANQTLSAAEVAEKAGPLLDDVSYLCLGGCFKLKSLLPAFQNLVADAKTKNVKVALDHGRITNGVTDEEREAVKALALQTDYYFPSTDEFLQLWDFNSIEENLSVLQAQARGVIVLKDGANGTFAVIDGELYHEPGFTVTPLHTVGAGDSFNAGFITAQHHGFDLKRSMRFACATAARKISRPTLPTLQDVEDFISANDAGSHDNADGNK